MATVNLVEVIKANPGCHAVIDNDCWWLYRADPSTNPHGDEDPDVYDAWDEANKLASDSDIFDPRLGDGGYGSGSSYGGDLLQALAIIVGVKVESV